MKCPGKHYRSLPKRQDRPASAHGNMISSRPRDRSELTILFDEVGRDRWHSSSTSENRHRRAGGELRRAIASGRNATSLRAASAAHRPGVSSFKDQSLLAVVRVDGGAMGCLHRIANPVPHDEALLRLSYDEALLRSDLRG